MNVVEQLIYAATVELYRSMSWWRMSVDVQNSMHWVMTYQFRRFDEYYT